MLGIMSGMLALTGAKISDARRPILQAQIDARSLVWRKRKTCNAAEMRVSYAFRLSAAPRSISTAFIASARRRRAYVSRLIYFVLGRCHLAPPRSRNIC